MAKRTEIDELNILEDYFDDMPISDLQKEVRVQLGLKLYQVLENLFVMMQAEKKVNPDFLSEDLMDDSVLDDDYPILDEYYNSYLKDEYTNAVADMTDRFNDDIYMASLIDLVTREIIYTTAKNFETQYYTSEERADNIAKNESNRVWNYSDELDAIAEGCNMKRWITTVDKRTRDSHMNMDGVEVGIFEPFDLGSCFMMYPMDESMGAGPEEICNCRCCVEYYKDDSVEDAEE